MTKPKIRFKQNDGHEYPSWKTVKLKDVSERVSRKNCNNETDRPLTIASIEGLVDQRTYFDKPIASRDMSGYYLLKRGEFAYNKSYSTGYDYGSIKRLDNYDSGALSTLYICFALNSDENSDFYNCYFNGLKWYDQMRLICAEGARNHGLLNVAPKDFFNIKMTIPSSKEEQQKITDFLLSIDRIINLIEDEINSYKELKKGLLQKMFPKKGSVVPEVRFPNYTKPWVKRKVGNILVERNEQAPKCSDYPLMAFIANEGVAPKGDRYDRSALINDAEKKLYKRTMLGDFIYSSNNLESGSIGLNKYGNASISPVYSIFFSNDLSDPDFIGYCLVRKSFINEMVRWRQGVVYGQWRIHESDFMKIDVLIPSIEEQKKIGSFFVKLDNLISLHQQELDKWKELKKGLLQQMFI